MSTRPTKNVAIDPVTIIIKECVSISTAMRKYSKISSQSGVAALLAGGGDVFHNQDGSMADTFNSLSTHKNNDPFLSGFIQLRLMLNKLNTLDDIDSLTVLQPFLLVVSTNTISGYITSLALDSLQRFINLSVIDQHSMNYVNAYRGLINALTHCRFEASEQISDDSVLLKVVMLLNSIISSPVSDYLSDSIMYDAIQTTMSLACNKRRADILKKAAESTMMSITLKVFGKLRNAEATNLIQRYINDESYSKDNLKDDVIGTGNKTTNQDVDTLPNQNEDDKAPSGDDDVTDDASKKVEGLSGQPYVTDVTAELSDETDPKQNETDTKEKELEPPVYKISDTSEANYGLPVARQYLTLLLSLIMPENQTKHTNSTRIFSVQLLTTIIELAGDKFPLHPRLFSLVSDPIFKCVLFIIQSNSKLSLLQAALQLFTTLVVVLGDHLQLQIELTLSRIFTILLGEDTNDSTDTSANTSINSANVQSISPNEAARKELLIEQVSILWTRSSSFFTSMFVNFDCNLDRADLALGFLKVLTKLSLPEAAVSSTENVPPICLEGLVSLIDDMYNRMQIVPENEYVRPPVQNEMLKQRERKNEFISCANAFNEKPKKGIPLLIEKKFIEDDTDKAIAEFLFENNSRMNKKTIGLLLCDPKKTSLLQEFIRLFNFKGLRVDEAIRILLTKFRLPGESQQIERIIEAFSAAFSESQDSNVEVTTTQTEDGEDEITTETKKEEVDNFKSENPKDHTEKKDQEESEEHEPVLPDSDSVFVLSYSIIMLNTDLHNPQVKEHMSFDEYTSNLRGCYNSKDFPHWYLDRIYCSIRDKEIVMPEEHHGNDKWFEDAWNNVIASTTVMTNIQQDTISVVDNLSQMDLLGFDKTIFKHVGPSIVNTLFKIYIVASADHITSRMLTTLDKCSFIAEFFKNKKLYNDIFITIGKITTLLGPNPYVKEEHNDTYFDYDTDIPLVEITIDEKTRIPVSNISVRLGKSLKSQLCCLMFFRILKRTHNASIISTESWKTIVNILKQLFENLLITPDIFTDLQEELKIGNLPRPHAEIVIDKQVGNRGLLSTFASYLKGDEEPTEEELDFSKKAFDCINNSNVAVSLVGNENIIVAGLINTLMESLNIEKNDDNSRYFEAELLFLVELIVALILFCKDEKELNNLILDKLASLTKLGGVTKRTIRRLLTYEILLISIVDGQEDRITNLIKDQLLGMTEIFNEKYFATKQGEELIKRVLSLTDIANYRQHILKDESYWRFLRWLASMSEHTQTIYIYVNTLIKANANSIIAQDDIFMFILGLLDEISSIGAVGSRWEQEYNKSVKSGHKVSNNNPYQSIVEISLKSINLTATLIENKSLTRNEIVAIIQALVHQCMNPCEQIQSYGLSSLESSLTERIHLEKPTDGKDVITLEDIINDGIMSIISAKSEGEGESKSSNADHNISIPNVLAIIGKAYLYHLEEGNTTNDTFLKILNIFNAFVEIPEIETQLQQLILNKKEVEKSDHSEVKASSPNDVATTPLNVENNSTENVESPKPVID
ncbi:ARF guanine-nucleotide exchange factor 2 [Monosporozyma servazzii]